MAKINDASKTQVEVRLIKQGNLESFRSYLKNERLQKESIKFLFESGAEDKIKVYVNTVYPEAPEFKKYQKQVMKYGDRSTLATYYRSCKVKTDGQIELIKRDELIPFLYFVSNYGLSKKAFEFLIENGSEEQVRGFIQNQVFFDNYTEEWKMAKSCIDVLVRSRKITYINMFYEEASEYEREALAQSLLKKSHKETLELILNNEEDEFEELKCFAWIL